MAGKFFSNYVHFMETYRGRDKAIRGTGYLAWMLAGILEKRNETLSKKLFTVMSEMSNCRVILRLFDDAAMLGYSLKYGLGKKSESPVERILQLVQNFSALAFYPIEHLAWACEKGIIKAKSDPWLIASLVTWILCLVPAIIQSLLVLKKILSSVVKGPKTKSAKQRVRAINVQLLNLVENCANLGMAVHWLPPSCKLWAGRLSNTIVGALGLTSTAVSVIKNVL